MQALSDGEVGVGLGDNRAHGSTARHAPE
jgi:hypothetical protein